MMPRLERILSWLCVVVDGSFVFETETSVTARIHMTQSTGQKFTRMHRRFQWDFLGFLSSVSP